MSNLDTALNKREPLTGLWLLDHHIYERWKPCKDQFLWLHGKSGCGKSVLYATVIDEIQRHCDTLTNSTFAYYLFDFSDLTKQSYPKLLASLITQLARTAQPSPASLLHEYDRDGKTGEPPRPARLQELLIDILASSDNVYLIIDALDECSE